MKHDTRLITVADRPRLRAFGGERPPLWVGVLLAALAVAFATAVIYPLKSVAPAVSLSVVYVPAVLLVSVYWGLALGLATSLGVALAAFVTVAVVVSAVAELARTRAAEAERRREEADLAAGLARELLAGVQTREVLGSTARRLAEAMTLPSAAIELGAVPPQPRRLGMALRGPDGEQVATLIVPSHLPPETIERLREHVVGPLGALVAIALHREADPAAVHGIVDLAPLVRRRRPPRHGRERDDRPCIPGARAAISADRVGPARAMLGRDDAARGDRAEGHRPGPDR